MTRRLALLIACLGAAACGGGDKKDAANPAASRTFTYSGAAVAPPAGATGAASEALVSADLFDASAGADAATGVNGALFEAADAALGGSAGFGFVKTDPLPALRAVRSRALALAGPLGGEVGDASFPPGCHVVAGGTVTFDDCTLTQTTTDGTIRVTLDGTVSGAPGTVSWDLVMGVAVNVSTTDGAFVVNATYHDAGSFAVTAATALAEQRATLEISAQGNGQSARLRVAQAADLDVDIVPPAECSTRIVDGTFEARRVWTEVPSQARGEPEFTDRGVKLDWTGCGVATAQFSAQ
jgi:hypothetical protein